MYQELMKRFDFGAGFKTLHPIDDMEIENDPKDDSIPDINELIAANERLSDDL